MSWYTRNLSGTATYWGPPVVDEWGDQTYPSPATVSCHWEERTEAFIDSQGSQQHSRAVVFVDTNIQPKGFLYSAASTAMNPRNVPTADLIRRVDKVRALKGSDTVFVAFL